MKALLVLVVTLGLAACASQPQSTGRNPSFFAPGAEPIPPTPLLERYYQVHRGVDTTTRDSLIEIVVQANFRSPRVQCTNLDGPPTRLSLSITRQSGGGGTSALLGVEYEAEEGLLVSGDRSLRLRLNGSALEPMQTAAPAPRARFTRSEKMLYAVTAHDLQRIVDADTASVHLHGRAGRCDSPVTGHARGLIALFLERELADLVLAENR
jgi:hypothetical protein